MDWHLSSTNVVFCVTNAVTNHADHVTATNELSTWLTIGWEDPVLRLKRHGLGDGNRFFSKRPHVKRKFTSALHLDHPVVEDPQPHHVFESLNQFTCIEFWIPFAFCLTIVVQYAKQTTSVWSRIVGGAGCGVRSPKVSWLFLEGTSKVSIFSRTERGYSDGVRCRRSRQSLRHCSTSL